MFDWNLSVVGGLTVFVMCYVRQQGVLPIRLRHRHHAFPPHHVPPSHLLHPLRHLPRPPLHSRPGRPHPHPRHCPRRPFARRYRPTEAD